MLDEEKKDISIRFSRFLTGIHHSGSEALDGIYGGNSSLINVLNWTGRGRKGRGESKCFPEKVKDKDRQKCHDFFVGMNM